MSKLIRCGNPVTASANSAPNLRYNMAMKSSGKNTLSFKAINWGLERLIQAAPLLARSRILRALFLKGGMFFSKFIHHKPQDSLPVPPGAQSDQAEFVQVLLKTLNRILASGASEATLRYLFKDLALGVLVRGGDQSAISGFINRFGVKPPTFLTISPGKTCNLQCDGCYASAGPTSEKLDWSTFDRIITEAKTLWGVQFLVISGGEPFAYRSDGKGLLDAAEKHPEVFFMVYTNGTLIDDRTAEKLASLGNVMPAISVEGWREKTDERRGAGVFDKILAAMERLRRAGVVFGVSLTATRHNAEELFSDKFIDFLFKEQGAFFGWVFHYMPIGRSYTLDLMPTPKQRAWMWERSWEIIRQKDVLLFDFWNHATLSNGCFAAGRSLIGGYLYIDWNGSVSPCVFVPYSPVNILKTYAQGGTLNDVWANPFFADIRAWQETYMQNQGNILSPCLNRDHHAVLSRLIADHEPDPIDDAAGEALSDPEYQRGLEEYGEAYKAISEPIWQEQYLKEK